MEDDKRNIEKDFRRKVAYFDKRISAIEKSQNKKFRALGSVGIRGELRAMLDDFRAALKPYKDDSANSGESNYFYMKMLRNIKILIYKSEKRL